MTTTSRGGITPHLVIGLIIMFVGIVLTLDVLEVLSARDILRFCWHQASFLLRGENDRHDGETLRHDNLMRAKSNSRLDVPRGSRGRTVTGRRYSIISALNSASVSVDTPSSRAFSSLEPASAPTTR